MDRLVHCNSTNQQKVLRRLCLWSSRTNHQQVLTSHPSHLFSFNSSSHVGMWELDYKESWAPKNWCFWTVVLEKTLESPLDCKEIQPVHPKGDKSWVFIGRTDVEAEIPILWPPDVKSWLIGKDPDAGKDWRWEEKGMRGWDGWMASPAQWTRVWASSGRWWRTGKPGILESIESQTVGHDWATEQHKILILINIYGFILYSIIIPRSS